LFNSPWIKPSFKIELKMEYRLLLFYNYFVLLCDLAVKSNVIAVTILIYFFNTYIGLIFTAKFAENAEVL